MMLEISLGRGFDLIHAADGFRHDDPGALSVFTRFADKATGLSARPVVSATVVVIRSSAAAVSTDAARCPSTSCQIVGRRPDLVGAGSDVSSFR